MRNITALKYKDKNGNDVVIDLTDKQFCFYFQEHARKFIAEMEPSEDEQATRKYAEFPDGTRYSNVEELREWMRHL